MNSAIIETLPHRRMEAWKWTDVRESVSAEKSGLTSACPPKFTLPAGLSVTRKPLSPSDTPMGKLATSFAGDAYIIIVPEGFASEDILIIDGLYSGHARIVFKLGTGAKLHVREVHESTKAGFANIEMRFDLAKSAELTRTILQDDHEGTTRVATSQINAWGHAKITQHTLAFGAKLTRFETRIAALGENLQLDIHGAYLLNEKRHCDMTSYIDLGAESARVRQSVKGVVTDKALGVFQGKFHVRRPAQFADAEMRHDAIMLSDTAQIRAKPELEIYADDVACAHGNTVGALDESALFYMRTRGIPISEARALLTQAFVAQSFEGMDDDAEFMSRITAWLEQNP